MLGALLLASVIAGQAAANSRQETIFQDDRSLLFSGSAVRDRSLDEIASLGADTIHSLVFWGRLAPSTAAGGRPRFDASNPADYPQAAWDPYDDLVRGATQRGLGVLLTPTGAIPPWASRCHGALTLRQDCRPSPHEFAMFVEALARRYSGSYRDENQGGGVLPRVSRWSIWNEPNQGGWLKPQYTRRRGRVVPASPHIYRALLDSAVHALRVSGHAHDQILLGETAPIGRSRGRLLTRAMSPGVFYRELFCLDSRGRPLRGHAAGLRPGCMHYRRPLVTGVAHHPYTVGAYRSPRSAVASDWVTVSTVDRLVRILDQAAHRRRLRRHASIWYTEMGYQTRPPDPYGVSPSRQAEYINESNWLAYRSPRVRSVAQYQLFDEPAVAVFNTGLRFANGRAKPALDAFRLPLWVQGGRRRITLFGEVRPAAPGQSVAIEFRSRHGRYRTMVRVSIHSGRGYFVRHFRTRRGYWRLAWTEPGTTTEFHSRSARS